MAPATQMIGGLISGLDTANIVEQLMQIERRPLAQLQNRVTEHQTLLEAYRGINNLFLQFQNSVVRLASNDIWDMKQTSSTNESVLTATAGSLAFTGSYTFRVGQLAQSAQYMSAGFADRQSSAVSPYQPGEIRIDSARSRVNLGTSVALLNGGKGIYHGKLKITDKSGASAVVDLSTAQTVQDAIDAINNADGVSVNVSLKVQAGPGSQVIGDALQVVDLSGGAGELKVQNYGGGTTATDLGIAGSDAATPGRIDGASIYYLGGGNTLASLRDNRGINNGALGTIRITDAFLPLVDGTTALASLNAGAGVNGGAPGTIALWDGTTNHVVDLSAAMTIGDVISEISLQTGGAVTAALGAQNNLELTALSGELQVFDDGALNTTATDLGIVGTSDTGIISGADLSRYSFEVDLSDAGTVQDVLDAINHAVGNNGVAAAIGGRGLALAGSGLGELSVEDVGADNTTALDLGIAGSDAAGAIAGADLLADMNSVMVASLTGRSIFSSSTLLSQLNDGGGVPPGTFDITDRDGNLATVDIAGATTVEDVLDAINDAAGIEVYAYADVAAGRIVIKDTSGGSGTLQVSATASSVSLGIDGDDSASSRRIEGDRVFSDGVNGVRSDSGRDLGQIRVSDDGGTTWYALELDDFTGANSLADVVQRLNTRAADHFGVGALSFRVNAAGNGIEAVNTSAGIAFTFDNLAGSTAEDLGLAGKTVAAGQTLNAGDLDRRYISRATRLDDLNGGTGVFAGRIRITSTSGAAGELNLSSAETVGEVIDMINSGALNLKASINATGDGILIIDTNGGGSQLTIEEVGGGSTARDLGILGSGSQSIDGSFERAVKIDIDDTLYDIMNKLDDSGAPVTSSIIYDGSEFTPYRLVVASDRSGRAGDFVLDTDLAALGFQQNTRGQDSILLYGQPGGAVSPVLLASNSNTNNTAVLGLSLDLHKASDEAVTVSVKEDSSAVSETIQGMVEGFNTLQDFVGEFDTFDAETYTPGLLFGDSAVRNLMSTISDLFFNTVDGVDGGLVTFYDIGVKFTTKSGSDGKQRAKLEIDSLALDDKLRSDFQAVRDLLTMTVDVARKDLNSSASSNTTADDDPNEPGKQFSIENLINGNTLSSDFGISNGYQAADTIANGQNAVTVSFAQPKKLSRITLHHVNSGAMPAADYALRNFKVEYLNAVSKQWETLRDVTGNTQAQTFMGFRVPTLVEQLRITASSTNAADGKLRLVEVEAEEVQGLSGTMNEVVAELADNTTGFFASQEERLSSQIDDLNESIEQMEERLEKTEQQYLIRFAAMESALAQMQSQGDFFMQQMDAWTNRNQK